MTTTMTGPLTFGQLSQLRDTESQPPEGRHQVNVWRVMPLDSGSASWEVSVQALRRACSRLRARHEALRTTYDFSDPARLRQIVHPAADTQASDIPEIAVPDGEDPPAFAERLAKQMQARLFDLTTEESWRTAIVMVDRRPAYFVTVVHHIAADLWSEDLMAQDFQALLAGQEPQEPADSPLELAFAQHSAQGQADREEYLRDVYTQAAAVSAPDVVESPRVLVNAVLDSRTGVAAAARKAASLRGSAPSFSVPSLVLAAYCYAAHLTLGVSHIMVSALASNRMYPGSARLVGNMVQWARILSRYTEGQPFDEFAIRLHENSLLGYRHGCYDVDVDEQIRRDVGPIPFEINFNYAPTEPDTLPEDAPDWRVRKVPAPYFGGPGFYLIAYYGRHLELTGRTRWEGFEHTAMETFLTEIHGLLT